MLYSIFLDIYQKVTRTHKCNNATMTVTRPLLGQTEQQTAKKATEWQGTAIRQIPHIAQVLLHGMRFPIYTLFTA